MERPGPMGTWTCKGLAAHPTFWREWTSARLAAGPAREAPLPWPAGLTEDDPSNAWIYAQHRDRSGRDVLADADVSCDRLVAAITALPEEDVTTPGRFAWLGTRRSPMATSPDICATSTSRTSGRGWPSSGAEITRGRRS